MVRIGKVWDLWTVVQVHDGKIFLAGSKSIWGCLGVEEVEARAVLCVLQVAQEFDLRSIIIESDCKLVIDALLRKFKTNFIIQSIIDNCLALASSFVSFSFCFCPRGCNGVTHRLASWAMGSVCSLVWTNDVPSLLEDALYFDLHLSES